MSLVDFFTGKPAAEIPVEPWQTTRLRELNRELARVDAELEAADMAIMEFFGGADPRVLGTLRGEIMMIPRYAELRSLELRRDDIATRRSRILAERGQLLR